MDGSASSPSIPKKAGCIVCQEIGHRLTINPDWLILPFSCDTATRKVEQWRSCMPGAKKYTPIVTGPQQRVLCGACVDFVKEIDKLEDKLGEKLDQLWAFLKKDGPEKKSDVESLEGSTDGFQLVQPVPDERPAGVDDNNSPIGEGSLTD